MTPQERALAEQRKVELHQFINSFPVSIDRVCFKKIGSDRERLHKAKKAYKLTVPAGYRPKTIAIA